MSEPERSLFRARPIFRRLSVSGPIKVSFGKERKKIGLDLFATVCCIWVGQCLPSPSLKHTTRKKEALENLRPQKADKYKISQ